MTLPKRIIVDQNGHYWRDFGDSLSMCPTIEANENTTVVASYEPANKPGREEGGVAERLREALSFLDYPYDDMVLTGKLEAVGCAIDNALAELSRLQNRVEELERGLAFIRDCEDDGEEMGPIVTVAFLKEQANTLLWEPRAAQQGGQEL